MKWHSQPPFQQGKSIYSKRFFRDGGKRREKAFRNSRLSRRERRQCNNTCAALQADEAVRIAINSNLRLRVNKDTIAEALLLGGRLLNSFELDAALENKDEYQMRLRLLKELRIYGARQGAEVILAHLPDDEHPIYGILDYVGDPFKMRGTYYGPYRLILKRDFIERSTFTHADSYGTESEDVFCWEDIAGVLIKQPHLLDPQRWYEYVEKRDVPEVSPTIPAYVEAQVLGPIYLKDVEKLYYPCHDMLDTWFMGVLTSLAEKYGFVLAHY